MVDRDIVHVFKISIWRELKVPIPRDGSTNGDVVALHDLFQKLVSTETGDFSDWAGDIIPRLNLVLFLHNALHSEQFKEVTFHTILHWLAGLPFSHLPFDSYSRSEGSKKQKTIEEMLRRLRGFISAQLSRHSVQALENCCSWITSNKLIGLPPYLTRALEDAVPGLLAKPQRAFVLGKLDEIFSHFLNQDPPDVDDKPRYRMTLWDRPASLFALINLVIPSLPNEDSEEQSMSKGLLERWLDLLKKKSHQQESEHNKHPDSPRSSTNSVILSEPSDVASHWIDIQQLIQRIEAAFSSPMQPDRPLLPLPSQMPGSTVALIGHPHTPLAPEGWQEEAGIGGLNMLQIEFKKDD